MVSPDNDDVRARDIIKKALEKKFKPEFLNRIDEAIVFNALTPADIHKIIYVEIANLEKRIIEMNYKLKISKEAIEFLGDKGYDKVYGARPLGRAIQDYIEDGISEEILNGNITEGQTISITLNKEKNGMTIKGIK